MLVSHVSISISSNHGNGFVHAKKADKADFFPVHKIRLETHTVARLQGVKKPPWYFLSPSYWGLSKASVVDKIHKIEESTDEDVLAEEGAAQTRLNQPMSATSAIEIRGLRATFKRGGKEFHAVKCPWYSVEKRQLFALLGPNGAGKTTTINMLTGFLPPTDGNA
jgi:ATP-binding cassette subfamily A (ABC1) protein 3